MLIWWLIGLTGLVFSIATLRVARMKRKLIPPSLPLLLMASRQVVRSAWTRVTIFLFLSINAPLVYRMFDIPTHAGFTDHVVVAAPFGIVFASGFTLMLSGAVVLWLLLTDTKELLG